LLDKKVIVIGAGLAGSEAAWQLANFGVPVKLVEMRPVKSTPAHHTGEFGELVCSNSFGALSPDRAAGLLQKELRTFRIYLERTFNKILSYSISLWNNFLERLKIKSFKQSAHS